MFKNRFIVRTPVGNSSYDGDQEQEAREDFEQSERAFGHEAKLIDRNEHLKQVA